MTKIYQLSTSTCQPCRVAKTAISNMNNSSDWWEYVDVASNTDKDIEALIQEIRPRSVPTFVVADLKDKKIYEVKNGYSIRSILALRDKYIEKDD